MAMGVAVVATPKGAEGIECENKKNIIIADKPEAFAAAIDRLATDAELYRQLAQAGRKLVQVSYDWQTIFTDYLIKLSK